MYTYNEYLLAGVLGGILVTIVFALAVVLLIYVIVAYVMQSLGFHKLAKRRGIPHAWLAWIPFGNAWILGATARDWDKRNGIQRRWDRACLILAALTEVAAIAIVCTFCIRLAPYEGNIELMSPDDLMALFGGIWLNYFVLMLLAMATAAIQYVCMFKVFESTVTEKALKHFLIYLLVPFAAPFVVFAVRNKGYEQNIPEMSIPCAVTPDTCEAQAIPQETEESQQANAEANNNPNEGK